MGLWTLEIGTDSADTAAMPAGAVSPSPAADRVLQVLATLAQQGRPLGVPDLMGLTGLARSTLYRQLARLRQWGFVLEHDGRYAPGPLSMQLAAGFDMASHLVHTARPRMQALSHHTRESVGLLVAVNAHALCLDMVESPHSLRCSFDKGRGVPLRAGASAKCLLAHLPPAARDAELARQFEGDAAGRAALAQQLADIARTGYAVSEGEVDAGVWGGSAPLFSAPHCAVGALTVMAPSVRAHGHEAQLIEQVVVAAARISKALAHGASGAA